LTGFDLHFKNRKMKSMTGYGVGESHSKSFKYEVSIRSVNGRFLETRFHVPKEIFAAEVDFKKIIEKSFRRGTVDVFVSVKPNPGRKDFQLVVNYPLAKSLAIELKKLSQQLNIKQDISIETLMKVPDMVYKKEQGPVLSGSEKKILLKAFEKACSACNQERLREGKSVTNDILKLLGELKNIVEKIHSEREEANQILLEKFEQKIKSKLEGLEIDSSRLSQEVVIQIEKSDINEELSRLKEHIQNYTKLIHESGAQGKKLDFYTQELLREINTIGSKSSLSKLTQNVVQAKTLIERLREQVQNVE
jgi:uncharacterized protein (TIGR00255 family)